MKIGIHYFSSYIIKIVLAVYYRIIFRLLRKLSSKQFPCFTQGFKVPLVHSHLLMMLQSLGLSAQTEKNPYFKKQVNQQIPKQIYLRGFSEESGQKLVVMPGVS